MVWRFIIAYVASSPSGRLIVVYRGYRQSSDREYGGSIDHNCGNHPYCSITILRRDREMRLTVLVGIDPPLHVNSSRRVEQS